MGSTHIIQSIQSPSGKRPIINHYDQQGRLSWTEDAFGNEIHYDHSQRAARIEAVTDRTGGQSVYAYDSLGNVLSVTNPAGETTTYTYTDPANPTRETSITTAAGTPLAHTITYSYDAAGNMTSETDTATGLTHTWRYKQVNGKQVLDWSVDTQGLRTENSYDASGNLTATIALDRAGNLLSKTTFEQYVNGQPRVIVGWVVLDPPAQSAQRHTRSVSTYNSQGLVTDSYQQLYAGTDPLDPNRHLWTTTARIHYGVDQRGNITSTTQYQSTEDAFDPTSGLTPDELNQNWTIALPHTSTAYDELGRAWRTTQHDVPSYDPVTGQTTLVDVITSETTYDLDGQVWRSYDARGNYSENEYDDLGQLTATHSYDAEDNLLSSTSTTYNANGQVITSTDALGNITRSYYDTAGRSVRTISPDNTSSETLYDALGRAYLSIDRHLASQSTGLRGTLSLYDTASRVIETQRVADLSLQIQELDPANHLVALSVNNQQSLQVLSHALTHYNALGQMDWTQDVTGNKTWYVYDDIGRQTDTIQVCDLNHDSTLDVALSIPMACRSAAPSVW